MLDAGGNLIGKTRHQRSDPDCDRKASGALGLGISSRKIADMATERPTFVTSLANLAPQGLIPAARGVLAARHGEVIGAVGITGDTSDNDETCALAGLSAVGIDVIG